MEKITGGNDFNLVIRAKRRTGTVTEDLSLIGIDDLQIFLTRAGRSKIMMSYALDVNGCAIIYVDKDDVAKGVWGVEMKGTCEGADLRAHKINAFEIVGSMGMNGVLADYVVEVVFAVNIAASDTFVQEAIAAHNEDVTAHPSLVEAIENAGKVDDVMVDGESIVDEDKVAHIDSDNFGKVDDVMVNGVSAVNDKVAIITIPIKVSDLDNDSEFVTSSEAEQMVEDASTDITIGNTTTGEPGTDAEVTNTGTAKDVVLDFTIPKGSKGDKGDKGEKGAQGDSFQPIEDVSGLVLAHVLGQDNTKAMSQKGVTDVFSRISDEVSEIYEGDIVNLEITRNDGYIKSDGSMYVSSTFFHTDAISISAGYEISVLISASEPMAVISRYDSDNETYIPLVFGAGSGIKKYTYKVEEDMQVVFSGYSNLYSSTSAKASKLTGGIVKDILNWINIDDQNSGFRKYLDNLAYVETYKITLDNLTGYVNSDPTKIPRVNTNSIGFYTSPIQLYKGDVLTYKGSASPPIAAIARYDDGEYTTLQQGKTAKDEKGEYVLMADEDMQVVISGYRSYYSKSSAEVLRNFSGAIKKFIEKYYESNKAYVDSQIDNLIMEKADFCPISAFNNIVAVGDSLTYCQVYTSSNSSRKAYRPWPETVRARFGLQECLVFANTGYDPIEIWRDYKDVKTGFNGPIRVPENGKTLAFIYLGTNGSIVDEYLETEAPESEVETYETSWANTNTGCYCKIIQRLLNEGADIILVLPRGGGNSGICPSGWTLNDTRRSIVTIADRFGVGYIDALECHTTKSLYHKYPSGNGSNTLHYNDWGYQYFAEKLIDQVSKMPESLLNRICPM